MEKKKIIAFLAVAIMIWAAIATWAIATQRQGSGVDPIYPTVQGNIYMDPDNFAVFSGTAKAIEGTVGGVIVPHPRQNASGTAESLATLAKSEFKKQIVLITFGRQLSAAAVSGDYHWQTPFGVVVGSESQLQSFLDAGVANDNDCLGKHADVGLMQVYLEYYLGDDSRVTPLVFDESLSAADLQVLLAQLKPALEDCTLLIVPPYTETETVLPFSDNLAWADLLSDGSGLLNGYLPDNAIRALMVMEGLLPADDNHILSLFYYDKDNDYTAEYFSNLLIFYGNKK